MSKRVTLSAYRKGELAYRRTLAENYVVINQAEVGAVAILDHDGSVGFCADYALLVLHEDTENEPAVPGKELRIKQAGATIGAFDHVEHPDVGELVDGVPCYTATVGVGGRKASAYLIPSPDTMVECA